MHFEQFLELTKKIEVQFHLPAWCFRGVGIAATVATRAASTRAKRIITMRTQNLFCDLHLATPGFCTLFVSIISGVSSRRPVDPASSRRFDVYCMMITTCNSVLFFNATGQWGRYEFWVCVICCFGMLSGFLILSH